MAEKKEKKIIKVESTEKKETKKKGGLDFDTVKDFVVDNKDTIVKVVEVAGTMIAAKKAKDALSGKKKTTKKTTSKKTTKKEESNDDPLKTITDLAGKFLG